MMMGFIVGLLVVLASVWFWGMVLSFPLLVWHEIKLGVGLTVEDTIELMVCSALWFTIIGDLVDYIFVIIGRGDSDARSKFKRLMDYQIVKRR